MRTRKNLQKTQEELDEIIKEALVNQVSVLSEEQ